MANEITVIGQTNFRNQQRRFGIKTDDRRRHIYVVGKTGTGKSTLLENMIIDDIRAGEGVAFLDPHGELAEKLLDFIPEERLEDTIYINPHDLFYPIAFNPLEQVDPEHRHLVASSIMGVFKKIWIDAWSARMQYILNNALLALLEYPGTTLLHIMKMLNDRNYRARIVQHLKDPVVKNFWVNEFARYSQQFEVEATAAIQNKVGQFITNPLIRNILGQSKSSVDLRKVMDEGKILIINLSKGLIGEDNSSLLGALMITKLQLAAMSRVNVPEEGRRDFHLYVDEFQNFATESFVNILSEARKYHLTLTVANQYLEQLDEKGEGGGRAAVRAAIFGNVGTIIIFRVGAEDAEFLEKEFEPEFMGQDMVNLSKYTIYIKMMIDGLTSRPFSAQTLPPNPRPAQSFKDVIVTNTRSLYAVPKEKVEAAIAAEWMPPGEQAAQQKISRKEERPLSAVLKPRDQSQIIKNPPRFQNQPPRERKPIDVGGLKAAIDKAQEKRAPLPPEGQKNSSDFSAPPTGGGR